MAVFTKLEKNEIEDFLKDYSIGNLISFEVLKVLKTQIIKLLLQKINIF